MAEAETIGKGAFGKGLKALNLQNSKLKPCYFAEYLFNGPDHP